MNRIKLINIISAILMVMILVIVFMLKNFVWVIPVFAIGLVLQVMLYLEHKKNGAHQAYLKEKGLVVLCSIGLIVFLFIKHTWIDG
ncbi:hypothetical protein [Penaeicola halotolerans]|uniref:hypothetical protein n=1 Tax=Penaeicola halotolerans TaxID=2793196 RepID=UPI001CF8AF9C|nr:hypothetical protein [Penaeicola halotolerans]